LLALGQGLMLLIAIRQRFGVRGKEVEPMFEIVDLGSGWGTLLFAMAKKYPDRQLIG